MCVIFLKRHTDMREPFFQCRDVSLVGSESWPKGWTSLIVNIPGTLVDIMMGVSCWARAWTVVSVCPYSWWVSNKRAARFWALPSTISSARPSVMGFPAQWLPTQLVQYSHFSVRIKKISRTGAKQTYVGYYPVLQLSDTMLWLWTCQGPGWHIGCCLLSTTCFYQPWQQYWRGCFYSAVPCVY